MRVYQILPFLIVCSTSILFGQSEGDKWVLGYYGLGSPDYSVMHLDFSGADLKIEWHFEEDMIIRETSSNICNSEGEALIWTNGMQIFGKNGIHISDSIAYSDQSGYWDYYYSNTYGPFGFPEHDGSLVLPYPDHLDKYLVIYHACENHPTHLFKISQYLSARIQYSEDSGFSLMYKDSLIGLHHQWYTGTLNAVRHANGRDWWVMAFEEDSPRYYAHLLDPSGIFLHHTGDVDVPVKDGLGDAAFSSRGNYMARMDAISLEEGQYLTLYSFDRCTGEFERKETFHNPEAGFFTGVSFSPSERYLYGDDNTHLWQWDLWSDDIAASQLLVDTFDGFVQPGWFVMRFGPMFEAPDGRIYIVPPAGSSEFMHVIDRPDLPANQCRFLQHHIDLKVPNGRSAPNLPNFRLGPLDDSPCDTLGLNNLPISRWRFEEDQPGLWKTIRFTDLSFFDPQTWHWDFDDGSTSEVPSPVHTFEPGLYHVCLTVANQFASDSTCHWIEILTTGMEDEAPEPVTNLSVSPNPFDNYISITSNRPEFRNVHLQLYDIHGHLVFNQPSITIPSDIYLPDFPSGVYLCSITDSDGIMSSFKLMKL